MNADRLMRMAMNRLMRLGMKRLSKGQKSNPTTDQARRAIKTAGRIRRM